MFAMVCSLNLNEAENIGGQIAMRLNQNCAESLTGIRNGYNSGPF